MQFYTTAFIFFTIIALCMSAELDTICSNIIMLNDTTRDYEHVCIGCPPQYDNTLTAGWYSFGIGNVLPFECTQGTSGNCETTYTYWVNYADQPSPLNKGPLDLTLQYSAYSGYTYVCFAATIQIKAAYCMNIRSAVYYLDGNDVLLSSRFCYKVNTNQFDTEAKNLRIISLNNATVTFAWEKASGDFNFTYEVLCNNISMVITNTTQYSCPFDSSRKSQITLKNANNDIPEFKASSVTLVADASLQSSNMTQAIIDVLKNITTNFQMNSTTKNTSIESLSNLTNILVTAAASPNVTTTVAENFIQIVNEINKIPSEILDKTQDKTNSSSKITEAVEKILTNVQLDKNETLNINTDTVKVTVFNIYESENFKIGIQTNNQNNLDPIYSNSNVNKINASVYAYVNQEAIESVLKNESLNQENLRLAIIAYTDTLLFQRGQPGCSKSLLSPQVIAIKTNLKFNAKNGQLVNLKFEEPVNENNCKIEKKSYTCVYWDYELNNGSGDWSSFGCALQKIGDSLTCICNHTTHFAMLMTSTKMPQDEDRIVTTISIVGCSISIFFLLITIIFFTRDLRSVFNSRDIGRTGDVIKENKKELCIVLIMFCVCLVVLNCIYISFTQVTTNNENLCQAIGVMLHFFVLLSFFLMILIPFYNHFVYYKLFKRFYLRSFGIYCPFLLAALIVLIVIVIEPLGTREKYMTPNKLCIISQKYVAAVLVPIGVVLVINLLMIFITFPKIKSQIKNIRKNSMINIKRNDLTDIELYIWLVLCLFMSGLTWTPGYILQIDAFKDVHKTILYFFCVMNSLQGFFMFLCRAVLEVVVYVVKRKVAKNPKKSTNDFSSAIVTPGTTESTYPSNTNLISNEVDQANYRLSFAQMEN